MSEEKVTVGLYRNPEAGYCFDEPSSERADDPWYRTVTLAKADYERYVEEFSRWDRFQAELGTLFGNTPPSDYIRCQCGAYRAPSIKACPVCHPECGVSVEQK